MDGEFIIYVIMWCCYRFIIYKYIMEVLLIVMNGGMYYVEENWFFFVYGWNVEVGDL